MYIASIQCILTKKTSNSMRANEEEVQSVSDILSTAVKTQFKRKQPISEVLEDVPACSPSYKPLFIAEQPSIPYIPANIDTPEDFFALFITSNHLQFIAQHININAEQKEANKKHEEKRKSRTCVTGDKDIGIGTMQ